VMRPGGPRNIRRPTSDSIPAIFLMKM
jgi:hypothetical protein